MGLFDNLRDKYIYQPTAKRIAEELASRNQEPGIIKAYQADGSVTSGVQRYSQNYNLGDNSLRRKPLNSVGFGVMRNFSTTNEIVRACINARKRQLTQLEWDIVPSDPAERDAKKFLTQINEIKSWFKSAGGYRVRFRELLDVGVDDLLTLDALAWYKQRDAGGRLLSLVPIDAATIVLRVDEAGNTPVPPEVAFKQIIRGDVVAEMTADELVYEMMNSRSNTPYGLSPIESLVLIISSALRAEMANLNYLTDGNIPEGFFSVPEGWAPDQIKEFQETFDAYLQGDSRATSKLRFMPGGTGAGFTATKKLDDMRWHEFNQWLMQVICAVYDIPPQELGFTQQQSTRANAKEQGEITMRRSLIPLANFFQEIFNDVVQDELGHPELSFKFLGLEDRDQLLEAQTQQLQVNSGMRLIDEVRQEDLGLDPLPNGWGSTPFIVGMASSIPNILAVTASGVQQTGQSSITPATSETVNTNGTGGVTLKPGQDKPSLNIDDPKVPTSGKSLDYTLMADEFRKMRDFAVKRVRDGKSLRPFESDVIPETTLEELNKRVSGTTDPGDIRTIFRDFMKEEQVTFLADWQAAKQDLRKLLEVA